jgi:putative endonuclease
MNFYIYILQREKNGKFYIGSTENLEKRLQDHNWSRTPSTKSGIPWKMVYNEAFQSRGEAIRRENEIKSKKVGSI